MIALVLAACLWIDDVASRAQHAWQAGEYAQAHDLWLSALDDPEMGSGPVLFNLGGCAYRLGQVPEAILWWERARRHTPRDPEIAFNLRRAEQELGLPPAARAWSDWLTARETLMLAVIVQSVALVGFVLWRRRGARIALAVLALATLPAVAGLVLSAPTRQPAAAVVLLPRAFLRAEPHPELPGQTAVAAGSLLRIVARSDRWVRVESASGNGWIERSMVGVVE